MPSLLARRAQPLRRIRLVLAAACTATALSGIAAASADAFTCRNNATFALEQDIAYVSTEASYTTYPGMLRARTLTIGSWEKYRMHCLGGGLVAIRSLANKPNVYAKYVSAEFGYSGTLRGMLRARATAIGPWERFMIEDSPGGGVLLRSTATNPNLYVSA